MKPVYQGCMEKGIQHVATHATEAVVGGGTGFSAVTGSGLKQGRSPKGLTSSATNFNGKLKSS